jgi:oxygen-independent coproporphyrinogen-3 oxidase
VKDPDDYKFLYRDYLWRGADMVSLGVSSFGHFSGTHYQNEAHIGPYMDRLKQGEFPIHRALTMTEDEKLLRELILQLKLGYLDSDYFHRKFGVDILNRFADAIRQLKEQQLMTIDDGQLRLTRRGLLEIDVHLPQFFLPEHRDARYT